MSAECSLLFVRNSSPDAVCNHPGSVALRRNMVTSSLLLRAHSSSSLLSACWGKEALRFQLRLTCRTKLLGSRDSGVQSGDIPLLQCQQHFRGYIKLEWGPSNLQNFPALSHVPAPSRPAVSRTPVGMSSGMLKCHQPQLCCCGPSRVSAAPKGQRARSDLGQKTAALRFNPSPLPSLPPFLPLQAHGLLIVVSNLGSKAGSSWTSSRRSGGLAMM